MKTNFKTSILAIALLASVTGAFASDISKSLTTKALASYSWDTFDEDGNQLGNDVAGTENSFDQCPLLETEKICAVGTPGPANPTLPTITRYFPD